MAIATYLAAIVVANLLAAHYGPAITPWTAFALIGLDLSLRDRLHDRWDQGRRWSAGLALRMGALIAAGGALSWLVNADAGRIALASTVAFTVAATLDAIAYSAARHWPAFARMNGSNLVGAAADSLLFPWLAFGALLPVVTAGQFAAKVAGGALWAAVIIGWRRRVAPAR